LNLFFLSDVIQLPRAQENILGFIIIYNKMFA
jgi:hypothetical protein